MRAGTSLCLFHSHPPARTFHHTPKIINALWSAAGRKTIFSRRRCLLPIENWERERDPKMWKVAFLGETTDYLCARGRRAKEKYTCGANTKKNILKQRLALGWSFRIPCRRRSRSLPNPRPAIIESFFTRLLLKISAAAFMRREMTSGANNFWYRTLAYIRSRAGGVRLWLFLYLSSFYLFFSLRKATGKYCCLAQESAAGWHEKAACGVRLF